MLLDLRFAFRQLTRNPGFTAVAVFTLALGIGANTAIFSMINAVLIEALPYPDAEQLVAVFEETPGGGHNAVSGGAYKDWVEHSTPFSHLAIFESTRRNLTGKGTPERVSGLMVSTAFLPALGVVPTLGRNFDDGADRVGGDPHVVLLTDRLWRSRYGAEVRIVGKTINLDQIPHTVLGVLPPGALLRDEALFLVPIVIDGEPDDWRRAGHWRSVYGRLRPGIDAAAAQTELRGIKKRLAADYPTFKEDWTVAVEPLREAYSVQARPLLAVLLGTVSLVLLIACVNVSNLLLARGNARNREMAIRASLGAHAFRIVRQTLIECLVLSLSGCVFGLLMAMFGVELLAGMVTDLLPRALHPELDVNVLVFSILTACGSALLFGILPALRASRPDLNYNLKETERGSTSSSRRRSQSFLVVPEFAFTVVLLVGAGLFLRSFVLLLQADPGFDPRHTLAFDLSFPEAKYPQPADRTRFIEELNGRIAALPGVESVGAVSTLPLSGTGRTEMASRVDDPERTDYVVACDFISGDYFPALGISLVRGRTLTAADNRVDGRRVLVIDSGVARDLYPGADPVGEQLWFLGHPWEIVGVVSPVRHFVMHADPTPKVYLPHAYSTRSTSLVLRSSLSPATLTETVRKTVLGADPDQPIANVRTLEQDVHRSLATQRTTLILLALFAAVAVCLASVGIYGDMSYAIGQRARELSIRAALGARRGDILRLVIEGGMKPSLLGIAIGSVAALALARVVDNLLFEIETYDPLVFAGSVGLLAAVAVLAIQFPARRAANADPARALRSE